MGRVPSIVQLVLSVPLLILQKNIHKCYNIYIVIHTSILSMSNTSNNNQQELTLEQDYLLELAIRLFTFNFKKQIINPPAACQFHYDEMKGTCSKLLVKILTDSYRGGLKYNFINPNVIVSWAIDNNVLPFYLDTDKIGADRKGRYLKDCFDLIVSLGYLEEAIDLSQEYLYYDPTQKLYDEVEGHINLNFLPTPTHSFDQIQEYSLESLRIPHMFENQEQKEYLYKVWVENGGNHTYLPEFTEELHRIFLKQYNQEQRATPEFQARILSE